MQEQKNAVLVGYFKLLKEEIHIRIQEHTRLVWIKIISLGAAISCLIGKFYEPIIEKKDLSDISSLLYFVWIIPIAAIVFDMLIAGNQRVIMNLGYYIKKYIENGAFAEFKKYIELTPPKPTKNKYTLLEKVMHPLTLQTERLKEWLKKREELKSKPQSEPQFKYWEEAAAQAKLIYHCYTVEDVFGIWVLTLASYIFSLVFRLKLNFSGYDIPLAVLCAIGTIYALLLLWSSLTKEKKF
ncbi:MAG TPA: hypothetical protein VMW72_01895 [Sedimentisphaerales bacterium]|nr:hypothetical protein [Sedimentisphaerales bacterium]